MVPRPSQLCLGCLLLSGFTPSPCLGEERLPRRSGEHYDPKEWRRVPGGEQHVHGLPSRRRRFEEIPKGGNWAVSSAPKPSVRVSCYGGGGSGGSEGEEEGEMEGTGGGLSCAPRLSWGLPAGGRVGCVPALPPLCAMAQALSALGATSSSFPQRPCMSSNGLSEEKDVFVLRHEELKSLNSQRPVLEKWFL